MKKTTLTIVLFFTIVFLQTKLSAQSVVSDGLNADVKTTTQSSSEVGTAIKELSYETYSAEVFPNPNNGEFVIKVPAVTEKTYITIYSSTGQMVHREKIYNMNPSLSLKSLAQGNYNVVVFDHNVPVFKTKFLKN